jgi:hypothetical protein
MERLQAFVAGDPAKAGTRQGSVRRKADIHTTDGETMVRWLRERDLPALLDMWLKGQEPAWKSLYAGYTMRRCALPTYAFARERYWFSIDPAKQKAASAAHANVHPLLHRNVSGFDKQSFVADPGGIEKAVRGLCVRPEEGLPELLPVEMVRLAVHESASRGLRRLGIELRSLVWTGDASAPLEGGITVDVHPTVDGEFEFEVLSTGRADAGEVSPVLLCEGGGRYEPSEDQGRIDV